MRSVTRKPPTTLIVPNAIAITSRTSSSTPSAGPITIRPPSSTIPWIAFVPDISGVCSVLGTFEMTSNPTKAASTRIASSVSRSIYRSTTLPSRATQAPLMTSSSKSSSRTPSSPLISSSSDSMLRA